MSSHRAAGSFKLAWLPLSLGIMLTGPARPAMGQEPARPVPKAICGPQDRPENVQGQTTLAERFHPGPAKAYTCNLELVGQFQGDGAFDGLAVFKHCAYYSTFPTPRMRHPGVVVLDVSDSRQPQATAYLDSPAMLDAQESLEVAQTRGLLLASKAPTTFDLYDLSADCRRPVLKSSLSVPGLFSHAGQFAPDGRTFYGAKWPPDSTAPPAAAVFALDVSDPSKPRLLATWLPPHEAWMTHGVTVNRDGTRAYVALMRFEDDQAKSPSPNGLVILDISDIQARRHHPQFRLISTLFWDDTHLAQLTLPVRVRGRPYLVFADIAGALGNGIKRPLPADACDSGKPGHGFARIIDLSDERHPRTASKLMLEVADPANCTTVRHDPVGPLGYGVFGCNVDNDDDAKLLACGQFESGLRVFDIREPTRPREVAYYKPPAWRPAGTPGALASGAAPDQVIVVPRFRRHGTEIWFTSGANGFQVVRFTDRLQAAHPELFGR